MKKVVVEEFGNPEVLKLKTLATPEPGPGQVRVAIKSIGMNHADLMARRGDYIISSGHPPFTPGLEAGGVIDAIGPDVTDRHVGQRIILGADAPRRTHHETDGPLYGGTYTSHYFVPAHQAIPAPKAIPDDQLGAVWLPYLTAWGCLVWKQKIQPGQFVGIPAASSSVGLAAAQIAKKEGAIPIGLSTSQDKIDQIQRLPENAFSDFVITHNPDQSMTPWHRDIKKCTQRHGVDVYFDPVAAGSYLQMEITTLAQHGTIWIYGLLGQQDTLDVTPLIRRFGSLRGWYLNELTDKGGEDLQEGYRYIFDGFEKGHFKQRVAKTFTFDQVIQAHEEMQKGHHIGKFILRPN